MIIQSSANILYAMHKPAQAIEYTSKPNAYINDLKSEVASQVHTRKLAVKSGEEVVKGIEFSEKLRDWASWYTPPKGHIVDDYA